MYVRILSIAHERRRGARNGDLGQTNEFRNQRAGTFYQDLKNIRMLAVVVGTFVFCWGPFFTFHFLRLETRNIVLFTIIRMLPWFNSICNPIIYACLDRKYREAFKRLYERIACS